MSVPLSVSNNQPVKEHSKRYSNKNRDRNQTIQTVNCLASDQLLDVLPVDCFPLLIGHQLFFMLCHSLLPLSSFRILLIFWLSLLSVSGALYPGLLQDPGCTLKRSASSIFFVKTLVLSSGSVLLCTCLFGRIRSCCSCVKWCSYRSYFYLSGIRFFLPCCWSFLYLTR